MEASYLTNDDGERIGVVPSIEEYERLRKIEDEMEDLEALRAARGVRGKYARRYAQGSNVVVLSPDVAEAFPDSRAVNDALRALIGVARQSVKHPE